MRPDCYVYAKTTCRLALPGCFALSGLDSLQTSYVCRRPLRPMSTEVNGNIGWLMNHQFSREGSPIIMCTLEV